MIPISRKKTLPGKQTRAYELLELAAIFGEFPSELLTRLSGGASYKETIVTTLKRQGLIKTYYKDGRRGLRPTITAKKLLLADNPERFSFYMDENSDTNHIRSEPHRRDRLYRIAEANLTMKNAGVSIFRDERPLLSVPGNLSISVPTFYPSREIKDLGIVFDKVKSTRSVGLLLTEQEIFVVYNFGNSLIRTWAYKTEMRTKVLVENEFCRKPESSQYSVKNIKGLILGNTMELAYDVLANTTKQYFLLDDNYENFYFVTNDERGEMLLKLLCRPELCDALDRLLGDDLCPADKGFLIENDAMTEDGHPVPFAYKCDLRRIRKFDTALATQKRRGIIYCFDYQAEVLSRYCSDAVEFQTLDYEKTERRFFS